MKWLIRYGYKEWKDHFPSTICHFVTLSFRELQKFVRFPLWSPSTWSSFVSFSLHSSSLSFTLMTSKYCLSLTEPGERWPAAGSGGGSWNTVRTLSYFYLVPKGVGRARWAGGRRVGSHHPPLIPGGCHLGLGKHLPTMQPYRDILSVLPETKHSKKEFEFYVSTTLKYLKDKFWLNTTFFLF